jgi:hypothetical protein
MGLLALFSAAEIGYQRPGGTRALSQSFGFFGISSVIE